MKKETKKEIQDIEYIVKESHDIFHTFHREIIGVIDTLETEECITENTSRMLRNRIFTLKVQSEKIEQQYYKIKSIAEGK